MTRQRKIVAAIGLAIYVVSFFMPAIAGAAVTAPIGWAPGYNCAWVALTMPLQGFSGYFHYDHFEYFALLFSGLINPVFVAAAILGLSHRLKELFSVLRLAVVVMIPFCWVVYYKQESYPREGHFFWILGMLLVLFSIKRTTQRRSESHAG